tara:strand:+ start:4639 stop:5256 length:618 start_codon:yes stop_codon:yes gene_type:complete
MCLLCLDIDCSCSKSNCKNIKCKRYFLPFILSPVSAIHPEIFNFYYFPVVVGFSAFILFWNFPKIVYYTASRPLYYEDLFIDEKKLPNYDVDDKLKNKFQCILEWLLIITNTLLVSGLSDWWLYKTQNKFTLLEVVGVTGGIIKIFQTVNNTISRVMLKILRKQIKQQNRQIVAINEKIKSDEEKKTISTELPKFIPKRPRFDTI